MILRASRQCGRVLGVALVLAVASCGGSSSSGGSSADSANIECSGDATTVGLGTGRICVDSGFRLAANDFSFPNWSGIEGSTDDMDAGTLIRLFGASTVCTSGTSADDCVLNPDAKSTLSQWADALDGGRCEGMSTLAMRYFLGLQDPSETETGRNQAVSLDRPQLTIDQEINTWWATQFMPEVRSAAAESRKLEPVALVNELIKGLKNKTGYTIGIYGNGYGHSVTPFAVTKNAGVYSVHIYDNNYPGKAAAITVDESSNKWRYDEAAVNPNGKGATWSGGKGTIELTPMSVRSGPFTEEFGAVTEGVKGNSILGLAVKSTKGQSAAGLLVTTASGKHVGVLNAQPVNEVSGATYTIGKGGLGTSLVTIEFPELTEPYSVQVVGATAAADAAPRDVTLSVTTSDGSRTQIRSHRALETTATSNLNGAEVTLDPVRGLLLAPHVDTDVTVSNNKDNVVVRIPKNGTLQEVNGAQGSVVSGKDATGKSITTKTLKKAAVRQAATSSVTASTHSTVVLRTSTTVHQPSTTSTLVRRSTTSTADVQRSATSTTVRRLASTTTSTTVKKPPSTTSTTSTSTTVLTSTASTLVGTSTTVARSSTTTIKKPPTTTTTTVP